MATVTKWTPFGVALDVTATGSNVKRTSATKFTVDITASWETYYDGAQTNYGMSATSGGVTQVISAFGTKRSNGTKTFTGTYSISGNGSATKTITVTFKNYEEDWQGNVTESATKNVTFNVTVPAWTSYTVQYNANGGTGAPGKQTKWKDQTLTISSTKPTRTGYSFQGWALTKTDADAGDWYYQPGGSCGKNENLTLYAVWKANTYAVNYNANGGTGAPGKQTKTYGVTLKLSSTKPTKTNYNFLGWGTSSTATKAEYDPGDSYTANSAITLYAVWELAYVKPRIMDVSITRCKKNTDDTYESADDGTIANVAFEWASDKTVSSIEVSLEGSDGSKRSTKPSASGTSGNVDVYITGLAAEVTYTVKMTVTDTVDYYTSVATLSGSKFVIDILAEGKGVAFNKPAELEGVADIGFQTRLLGGLLYVVLPPETDLNDVRTPGFYVGENVSTYNYTNCPLTSGTFTLEVLSAGTNGQVWQRLTLCDKTISATYERFYYGSSWPTDESGEYEWVRTSDFGGKLLWQGVYYMSESQIATLAEPVHMQNNGIVLVFSRYSSGQAQNYHFNHEFVHKMFVSMHPGVGNTFLMTTDGSFSVMATKYLYIHDDRIVGNANNESAGTGASGIKYENNGFVLRYVIGV